MTTETTTTGRIYTEDEIDTLIDADLLDAEIARSYLAAKRISQQQADEIVLNSDFEDMLDGECEITEDGYAYGLENGEAVVVSFEGRIYVESIGGGLLPYSEWLETDEAEEFETARFTEACRAQQDAIEAAGGMNAYHDLGRFTELLPTEWEFWASEGNDEEPLGIDGLPMVFTAAHDWN